MIEVNETDIAKEFLKDNGFIKAKKLTLPTSLNGIFDKGESETYTKDGETMAVIRIIDNLFIGLVFFGKGVNEISRNYNVYLDSCKIRIQRDIQIDKIL